MNGCRRAAPSWGRQGAAGTPNRPQQGRGRSTAFFFRPNNRLPAACRWLGRLLAAPLFLLQPAAAQAEAGASEDRTGTVAARIIRAAGAAGPDADRLRPAPRREPRRHGDGPLPAALLLDDNADDDSEEALALPGPARAPLSMSAPAAADALRPLWWGGGIRGPPRARAPPAPRVLRTAPKESRGGGSNRRLSAPHNNNNARPSPAATRPARPGTA